MKKYNLLSNIRYVYKESFKSCHKMWPFLIVNFLSTLLVPIMATLASTIVVYALTNHLPVTKYIWIMVIFCLFAFIFEALKYYSFNRYTWENTFVRCGPLWVKACDKALEIDYENFEPKEKQRVITRGFEALSSNWVGLEGMAKAYPVALINLSGLIVYAVIVAIYSPWVLLILVVMSIINFFLTKRSNDLMMASRDKLNNAYTDEYYLTHEVSDPRNGKDVRLYKMQKWFDNLFSSLSKERMFLEGKIYKRDLFANETNTIFLFIRDAVAYTTLIMMASSGKIDASMFTFLIGIVSGFTAWLNGFTTNFNTLRKESVVVSDYRSALDIKDNFNHSKGIDVKSLVFPLSIVFDDVSFKYPGSLKYTISHLSFNINPGEKIALVGNNGAGKTTIVKLLCGLYTPTEGKILINGHEIKEFNLEEYMKILSVVFQDSEPLAFDILTNVKASYEDVDLNKFEDSIAKAGLKDKIDSLENKEKTFLTKEFDLSGIQLSGGEKQKLMLARALYKGEHLLILDEPTASLDPISEEKMYLTYNSFAKGNTSLFISHRLSSTKFCDRIIYLENGKIEEEGTHKELIALNKKYKEMFDIQSKYYKEENQDGQN